MKRFCFTAVLVLLLAFPVQVRADVAPPIYPPGSNPGPGAEVTQVRMAAERVVIDVQRDMTAQSLGRARITADFTMHNLGVADESMAVRFPLGDDDGRGQYQEIGNLQISVNGKQVNYRRAEDPHLRYTDMTIPWAEFDVTFPAGQDVPIRVVYELRGSGYYPFTAFYYILETGAGWKDTIGSADVILRLPYEASPQNVIIDMPIGWAETTHGGVFQGNEVRWHFDDFEPGANQPVQNMEFALVAPAAWQNVVIARANVDKNPSDGEAWGILGKAYKPLFFLGKGYREDPGGLELYRLSVEAYEKCLALKPNDAQWHAGFADLLAQRAMWDSWFSGPTPETFRALEEIHTALALAPNDPVVREIAQNLTYMTGGGIVQTGGAYDFPWLTQTPTALPSSTPTAAAVSEFTVTPSPPPIAMDTALSESTPAHPAPTGPTSVPQAQNPLCGSVVLLPLTAGVWLRLKRSPKIKR